MPNCTGNLSFVNLKDIINSFTCLLGNQVVFLLFALAMVAFIWGVIQFYLNPENEEKRKKGKSFIIGGLIALFVMVSVWGIVKVFTTTFGITPAVPVINNINGQLGN